MNKLNSLMTATICCLLFSGTFNFSSGQENNNDDVKSLDGIITALYASISGEKGVPRDWDRFSLLFTPDARLIPTSRNQEGKLQYNAVSPADYIKNAEPYFLENGFFEKEIYRVKEEYGPIVHIFSTYESRSSENDSDPFNRGINSIQLFNDGERWWIMTIFWSHELKEAPLPQKYLPH